MSTNFKAHLALLLANLLYGINYVIAKGVMPIYIAPEALIFLRIVPSAILFWTIGLLIKQELYEKPDFRNLFLAAFFGVFINQFLFIKGLSFTSPIDASIIITSNPILVMIVASIVLKERITKVKLVGIIIGASGALLLVGGKGFLAFDKNHLLGNILLFANSISFAIYMSFARPLMQKYSAVYVLKWTFLFGSLLYLPLGMKSFVAIHWHGMSLKIIMALTYIVLITTVLTYFLINYGLRHLKSTTVSIYIYVQPVVSAITAIIVGVDSLSWLNISASIFVFSGVYLVSKEKR